jgi:DNA-binding CsgD family transcriptional regulator
MSAPLGGKISAREMQLVAMLARGHTTVRAARELRLSRYTVGEEISALLGKFNCRNRAELVAYCYVHSLLPVGIWPPPYGSGGAERPIDLMSRRRNQNDARAAEAASHPPDVRTLSVR